MIERITEEEERASEAIANLAGRNGINFKPLLPSNNDIRTLEHEGLFFNHFKNFRKIRNFQKNSENSDCHLKNVQRLHIYSSLRFFPITSTLDVRNGIFQFLW